MVYNPAFRGKILTPINRISPKQLLDETQHRPFPLPQNQSWVMAQSWQKLLFAHYKVDINIIRPMIPSELEIDAYDGEVWISIVPFLMNYVHLRGLPPFPTTGKFPELNVRTYVKHGDKAGVWFFSLDAASILAVTVARLTFNLPYYYAKMSIETKQTKIRYKSHRKHPNASPAHFDALYEPTAPVQDYDSSSLDRWLTDRYVLYSANRQGKLFIGHITHLPWQLQPASVVFAQNTLSDALGISLLDTNPLLHYVEHIDVIAWSIQAIS